MGGQRDFHCVDIIMIILLAWLYIFLFIFGRIKDASSWRPPLLFVNIYIIYTDTAALSSWLKANLHWVRPKQCSCKHICSHHCSACDYWHAFSVWEYHFTVPWVIENDRQEQEMFSWSCLYWHWQHRHANFPLFLQIWQYYSFHTYFFKSIFRNGPYTD